MKSDEFALFTRQAGLRSVNPRMSAGMVGKWLVLAVNGGRQVRLSFDADIRKDDSRMKKEFRKRFRGSSLKLVGWMDRSVVMNREGESVSRSVLKADLETVISALESCGALPVENCPICGKPHPDRAGFYGNSYVPVHRKCLEDYMNAPAPVRQDENVNQPYANGVMGMLGAVAVITLLSILQGRVLTFTFILIPLAVFYVYGRSGGKTDDAKKIGVYTALVSLVGFFLAILLISAYDLYRNGTYSFMVALGAMIRIMSTGIIRTVIKNTVPLVITAVGVMLVVFGVSSRSKKVSRGSDIVNETIIDL